MDIFLRGRQCACRAYGCWPEPYVLRFAASHSFILFSGRTALLVDASGARLVADEMKRVLPVQFLRRLSKVYRSSSSLSFDIAVERWSVRAFSEAGIDCQKSSSEAVRCRFSSCCSKSKEYVQSIIDVLLRA